MRVLNDRTYKVFVDFDGTISKQDVGEEMFYRFGNREKANEYIELWKKEKVSSAELWRLLFDTLSDFNRESFMRFLDDITLDSHFNSFVKYCRREDIDIFVVSDGFDIYINELFRRNGLEGLKLYCNNAVVEKNRLVPSFPFTDEECARCANCKRNHVVNNSSDDDITVYVGDGYSDTCPAQYVDFIFAKRDLLKYCEKNRISYYPFTTFSDVQKRMEEIKGKKRIRKRHQAELKRRELYQRG